MGKGKDISLAGRIKPKKIKKCITLKNMAILNNHKPDVHFINFINNSVVFTLWKWVETSSTTSLFLIRTSSN